MKYAIFDTEEEANEQNKALGSSIMEGKFWERYSTVVDMPDGKFGFYVADVEGPIKADHLVAETVDSEEIPIPEEEEDLGDQT